MEKWYTLGKFVSGLIPRLTSARDTGAVTCQREGDIGDWTSRLISFEIKRLIFRWCSARFQPLSRFFVRKFLVSPTVLKNLRYFIRPLYFSRTVASPSGGVRVVKNLRQQTTAFRNPRIEPLFYSLFSRSNFYLSSFRIWWKIRIVLVINLHENSYRGNWNSFLLFLRILFLRFRAKWINFVTNIFNKKILD